MPTVKAAPKVSVAGMRISMTGAEMHTGRVMETASTGDWRAEHFGAGAGCQRNEQGEA
ncbi:MAG: hypothetical protein PHE83_04090 [Opitutaceae bacterium]|nr:hypothetical protein [Opitutaceae bacterium]